jgi:cytochrome c oxidase subunit 2
MTSIHSDLSRVIRWFGAVLVVGLAVGATACSGDPYPQSSLHPTSDQSGAIDKLFTQIFWLAVFVFVVVQAVLVYTLVRFRRRPGQPDPKHVHGNTLVEIAWTLAPAVILVFVAVPTIQTIFRTSGRAPSGALQVEVIGHQWWWEFRYPDFGVVTANELHLPQGQPVQLTMTSADVIHSFWVPRVSGKRDLMAGRTTRLAFTADSVGTFLGQCAEYCGDSHANMRLRLMVDSPADFNTWVQRQQNVVPVDSADTRLVAGETTFRAKACIACHTIQGVSGGVLGPNLSHVGGRTTIAGGILPNDADGLARWLRDPQGEKPGSLMINVPLTDDEVAALVAYLQSKQ